MTYHIHLTYDHAKLWPESCHGPYHSGTEGDSAWLGIKEDEKNLVHVKTFLREVSLLY